MRFCNRLESLGIFAGQMTEPDKPELAVPAFFKSDTPIRKSSKIPRRDAPKLVLAFCWPKSIFEAAEGCEYSPATVKRFYFKLRDLLSDPRYRKWHGFDRKPAYQLDRVLSSSIDQLPWAVYAECYLNSECQRNFLYGKRERRECQVCPILGSDFLMGLLQEKHRAWWLSLVDDTRDFYLITLRIRREEGYPRLMFRARALHQTIVNRARHNSRLRDGSGWSVDHFKEGPGTVLDLWSTLLAHIEERGEL